MTLHPGMKLNAERFVVQRPLGEGGMGAAYLVEDSRLGRECVIKEVLSHDTTSREQFEREARLLAGLQHPSLPVVYDYFIDGDSPYIVMEYVRGLTLNRKREERTTPFEPHDVIKWALDLLEALEHMHGVGVIHRDIKPHNVAVTPDGKAVLLDFGIAREVHESQTRTAAQAVTQHYAPVEQYPEAQLRPMPSVRQYVVDLRAHDIRTGPYSDIYSLGATLYYALTLMPPTDACMRLLNEEIPPIREQNEHAPDFLIETVMKALEIDPRRRFQTATSMRQALQAEPDKSVEDDSREPGSTVTVQDHLLPQTSQEVFGLPLIYVAAGKFLMGSDDNELKEMCRPQHWVKVDAYCIGQRPVTNADYQRFIQANPEYPVPFSPLRFAQRYNWDRRSRSYPRGLDDHPVVLVTWEDAVAYCDWLSDVSRYHCRLPSEGEWEKVARWDPDADRSLAYPWGNDFNEERCNVDAHGELRLESSPVDAHSPAGDSPYGLQGAAGNVWEWTSTLYRPYPYDPDDGRQDPHAEGERVVRGGAYDAPPLEAHCAWRHGLKPELKLANTGFRIACDAA